MLSWALGSSRALWKDAASVQMSFYSLTSTQWNAIKTIILCVCKNVVDGWGREWNALCMEALSHHVKEALQSSCFQIVSASLLTPAQWHPFPCTQFCRSIQWTDSGDRWEGWKIWDISIEEGNSFGRKDGARMNIEDNTRSGKCILLWQGILWQTHLVKIPGFIYIYMKLEDN